MRSRRLRPKNAFVYFALSLTFSLFYLSLSLSLPCLLCSPQVPVIGEPKKHSKKGLSPGAIMVIVIANCVALLMIISFVVSHFCARERSSNSMVGSENGKRRKSGSSFGSKKKVYANGGGDNDGTNATDQSKLVFFDQRKPFELED